MDEGEGAGHGFVFFLFGDEAGVGDGGPEVGGGVDLAGAGADEADVAAGAAAEGVHVVADERGALEGFAAAGVEDVGGRDAVAGGEGGGVGGEGVEAHADDAGAGVGEAEEFAGELAFGVGVEEASGGFADEAMTAMFIGLVSAYIASYIGQIVSENGLFSFTGNWLPLAVAFISALAMLVFLKIKEAKNAEWLDSFSVAGSMLFAMTCAIFLGKWM